MQLPDAEIAKLLYRDAISLKHGSRSRLSDELESKSQLSGLTPGQQALCNQNEKTPRNALTRALIQHLLKARVGSHTKSKVA